MLSKTLVSLLNDYYNAVYYYGELNGKDGWEDNYVSMKTYTKAENRIDEVKNKLMEYVNENMVHK